MDSATEAQGGLPWGAFLMIAATITMVAIVVFLIRKGLRVHRDGRERALTPKEKAKQEVGDATVLIASAILVFAFLGGVATFIACLSDPDWVKVASSFGFATLIGGTAGSVGAMAGFIFGIPRTVDAARVAQANAEAGIAPLSRATAANTNLERVSDWLTALLLGATLVQLRDIPDWLARVGTYVGSHSPREAMVPFVVIYFFGLGFLGVYLVTRLYLTSALDPTLDILSGGGEEGAPELGATMQRLEAALSGNTNTTALALGAYEKAPLVGGDRLDPGLNALLARLLAKYRASIAADPERDRHDEELQLAVIRAGKDENLKARLQQDIADGTLTTGDDALNARLVALLS